MHQTLKYISLLIIEVLRQPSFLAATIGFPVTFYLIFGVPEAKTPEAANFLLGSFSSFTVLGVVFVQFGNGLAQEREATWSLYLKTLPLTSLQMFLGRVVASFLLATLAVACVALIGVICTPVAMSALAWCRFTMALASGAVPFLLLGWILGSFTSSKAALPLGNLVYLPLSYAGGLWVPPELLPGKVRDFSNYLLTRHYGEIVWASTGQRDWKVEDWMWIAGYTVILLGISLSAFRRDQIQRFS